MNDTIKALCKYELWLYLGWIDVAQRYKRSKVGPLWLTLNNAVITLALSIVWAKILNAKLSEFLPYFAISNIIWVYISTSISEAASVLTSSENLIKQIQIPISSLVLRLIARNTFILAHLAPVPFIVFVVYPSGWATSLASIIAATIGLIAICSFLVFACTLLSVSCTRFRDIIQAVPSALQMVFLATPILWKKELLVGKEFLYEWNIFYHLIEVVRLPLIENTIPIKSLLFVFSTTVLLAVAWAATYKKYRASIVYWL